MSNIDDFTSGIIKQDLDDKVGRHRCTISITDSKAIIKNQNGVASEYLDFVDWASNATYTAVPEEYRKDE